MKRGSTSSTPSFPCSGHRGKSHSSSPLYQAAAAIVMDVGVPEDTALRLTGLASFILAAGLLWLLVRGQAGWPAATVAMGVFLFSPLGIAWGRAALIEYLALALSLGFAMAGIRWRDDRSGIWFMFALALGCLAALVKITTAVFWILPFALLAVRRDDDRQTGRSWAGAWFMSLAPLAVGLAWTRHADAIKAATAATAWLTSGELQAWNFGTMAQRIDMGAWSTILENAALLAGGIALPLLAWPAVRFATAERQMRFWIWIAATVAGPILIFFNLYVVHDYYAIAVSASVAALVGLGVAGLPLLRPLLRTVVATLAVVAWVMVWSPTRRTGRGSMSPAPIRKESFRWPPRSSARPSRDSLSPS